METVAVLSDIHGVLPALDAVLAEPAVRVADRIVLTGDIAAGPQPGEVLDRLIGLGDRVTWVRGNADRELIELARGEVDDVGDPIAHWAAKQLGADHLDRLASLPLSVLLEVGGFGPVLFCHATPRDDAEVVVVDSRLERWAEVLAGLPDEVMTVVCGHTHMPFARLANRRQVVNPGSVGMPYGRAGAHWALLSGGRRRAPADGLRRARRVRLGLRRVGLPGHRRVDRLLPELPGQRRRRARGHGPPRRPVTGRGRRYSPGEGGDAGQVGRETEQRVNGPPARSQRADRRPVMTLTYRQERLLRRADRALSESDPDLATMLSIFARITAAEGLPAWEQLGARLTRALTIALWPVAALVFLATSSPTGRSGRRGLGRGGEKACTVSVPEVARTGGRGDARQRASTMGCHRGRIRSQGPPGGGQAPRRAARVPGW